MFDWLHHGEGLLGLQHGRAVRSPRWARFRQRVHPSYAGSIERRSRRGRTTNTEVKIIRSLFNGSRGPPAPQGHGAGLGRRSDRGRESIRARPWRAYLPARCSTTSRITTTSSATIRKSRATNLALNAYMLTRNVQATRMADRVRRGLASTDGRQRRDHPVQYRARRQDRGACDGKWYGGVYGWGFTVIDPVHQRPVNRNNHHVGINGFGNAYLLTGDDRFLEASRRQIEAVNSHAKVRAAGGSIRTCSATRAGTITVPALPARRLRALLLVHARAGPPTRPRLRLARVPGGPEPDVSRDGLAQDFDTIRQKNAAMRQDTTTPDTRLADDPMAYNPATVANLVNLMLGGMPPKHQGEVLQARVRYFDPSRRRPGLPEDVASLVDTLKGDSTSLTLVNLNPIEPRTVIVQGGGYGEHLCDKVDAGAGMIAVGNRRSE